MAQNLYLIVAVAVRLWAVFMVLSGLYAFLLNIIIVHEPTGVTLAFIWPIIAGIILWLLAKPVARLVTTNV